MTATTGTTEKIAVAQQENPLVSIADFIVRCDGNTFPGEVTSAVRKGVVDLLGVMVMGAGEQELAPLLSYVDSTYASGGATALGIQTRKTAEAAAYVNAAAGHLLDFDDCHDALGGHPTVVVLPAVLALVEELNLDAAKAIEAYVIGVEVESALGRCLNHTHYERGWHPTATLGIFGATAASASLLGLDLDGTMRSLAIAASLASGIKGNFGTFMKPGQVGFAAAKGVQAARLAQLGVSANTDIFLGRHSFPDVFNSQPNVDWSSLESLGKEWNIVDPGLVFKLYPCCGSTHAPIDATLALRERDHLNADDVAKLDVFVHPRRIPHTNRPNPLTGLEGKFSVQYAVAAAVSQGSVTVADFDKLNIQSDGIQKLLSKVELHPLPEEEQTVVPGRLDCFAASVRITDNAGVQHYFHVDAPKGGDPANLISLEDLQEKFVAGVGSMVGLDEAGELLSKVGSWVDGRLSSVALMDACGSAVKRRI
ncbi:MAG: MmgE/PrpD family protein [Ferrimicrobium sp.]